MSGPPSPAVLRAFGAVAPPVRLPGGQGVSWRSDDLVLKPVDDEKEVRWRCDLLEHLPQRGFRVPAPVRAADGAWVAGGWTASRWVDGEPGPRGRWPELFAAGEAFHRAVRGVPRPSFLDRRTHPWACGDRAAWGEARPSLPPAVRAVRDELERHTPAAGAPPSGPSQLVHGDLAGNVLFHPTQPPAVIDLSPYWRPAGYATGVAVVDGLLTGDDDPALVTAVRRTGRALVARGALFRLHVLHALAAEAGTHPSREELAGYRALARLLDDLPDGPLDGPPGGL